MDLRSGFINITIGAPADDRRFTMCTNSRQTTIFMLKAREHEIRTISLNEPRKVQLLRYQMPIWSETLLCSHRHSFESAALYGDCVRSFCFRKQRSCIRNRKYGVFLCFIIYGRGVMGKCAWFLQQKLTEMAGGVEISSYSN